MNGGGHRQSVALGDNPFHVRSEAGKQPIGWMHQQRKHAEWQRAVCRQPFCPCGWWRLRLRSRSRSTHCAARLMPSVRPVAERPTQPFLMPSARACRSHLRCHMRSQLRCHMRCHPKVSRCKKHTVAECESSSSLDPVFPMCRESENGCVCAAQMAADLAPQQTAVLASGAARCWLQNWLRQ